MRTWASTCACTCARLPVIICMCMSLFVLLLSLSLYHIFFLLLCLSRAFSLRADFVFSLLLSSSWWGVPATFFVSFSPAHTLSGSC